MKHLIILSILALTACAQAQAEVTPIVLPTPKSIEQAVASPFRTEVFKARDKYRHPSETLKFFGLKSNMKVLEVIPGAGWYLEIIAPYVNDNGKYVMAIKVPPTGEPQSKPILEWSKMHPEISQNMSTVNFDLSNPALELGVANSMDMVLTFRNVHNWMANKSQDVAFKAFFNVLKKGGVLGVVEHRAPEDRTDPLAPTGYVRKSDLVAMAKKAGFRLAAESEINANPKDKKDYKDGVWTLPPTLTLKEVDREKYLAIGESDRMTLKFVKP